MHFDLYRPDPWPKVFERRPEWGISPLLSRRLDGHGLLRPEMKAFLKGADYIVQAGDKRLVRGEFSSTASVHTQRALR